MQKFSLQKPFLNTARHLVLMAVSISIIIPFAWMIVTSLKTPAEIMKYPPTLLPQDPTLENFIQVFQVETWDGRSLLLTAFLNSTIVAVSTTLLGLLTCSMAGYAFAKIEFKHKNFYFWLLLVMLMIPSQITLIPVYVIVARLGWVDTLLPLILPVALLNPYGVFLMRQYVSGIPTAYIEAARIDGASHWQIFFQIVLPMIKPALITLGLLLFLGRWNDFFGPLIYLSTDSNFTLPLALNWFRGRYTTQWGLFMAASAVSVFPIVILYLLGQEQLSKGVSTISGLKM
jgi:multiple sugar transport system permease protein